MIQREGERLREGERERNSFVKERNISDHNQARPGFQQI